MARGGFAQHMQRDMAAAAGFDEIGEQMTDDGGVGPVRHAVDDERGGRRVGVEDGHGGQLTGQVALHQGDHITPLGAVDTGPAE